MGIKLLGTQSTTALRIVSVVPETIVAFAFRARA